MSEHHIGAHDPLNVTNPEHADHHIVSPGQYVLVYVTLLILTGVTVGAAYIPLGVFNPVVALLIACIKGAVVILFFMHAIYQSRLIKLTIGSGFFLFLVLIMMTMLDYMSRAWGAW
ncbi:cytochrome c oxidase subunit 4 [Bryocella elongata]|uniref:Cytochrome c oxidase subunit 4 n=1 Tax=Bryocella elongata TaxID=863522 RepID=A0A1H5YIG3_9BACT|nr:cytochrome C oxidase subunit IV family protein [Bryocella elongata]SEG23848.1 cytochrome c oxidase subunit 4 [Bryocella elongata]